jgi:hypothetical protein
LTDKSRVFVPDHEAPTPEMPMQGKTGFVGIAAWEPPWRQT